MDHQTLFENQPIPKIYFKLSIPLVTSLVITMIYNFTDTYFIALTRNTDLIAGVALSTPIFTLLMAMGNIYAQGSCTLVSRLLGQNARERIRRASSFAFYAAVITGVLVGALMLLFRVPLLGLLGADSDTFRFASDYYLWLAIGAPMVIVSFVHNNLLRSLGMSKEAMVCSVSGSVLNMILDPIFILLMGMGASGAALATVLGYVLSVVMQFILVAKKCPLFSVNPREMGVSASEFGQIFAIGIPAAVTNLTQSFSMILINQSLLPFGNDKIAAMGIALKIATIALLFTIGFSFGPQPIFGYLYGAKNWKRLKEAVRFCYGFNIALAAVISALLCLFAFPVMGIFLPEPNLLTLAVVMLRWQVAGMVFTAITTPTNILFLASGKAGAGLFLSIARQGVVFYVVITIASRFLGMNGIMASQFVADIITALCAIALYLKEFGRIEQSTAKNV